MLKKDAYLIVGGLSEPSKMPGKGYGLPASACKLGSLLAARAGTPCHDCYALKGNYRWSNVKKAHARRLEALSDPRWVEAMVVAIEGQQWFRWHDSGDLQSVEHLENIAEIARRMPNTRFWLPTREVGMVRAWLAAHPTGFPENLRVRLSAAKVDAPAPPGGSTVVTTPNRAEEVGARFCPAPSQGGECRDCRTCWISEEPVAYLKH